MRTMKPPHKYGEVDLVAFALSIADNIESNQEPSTYEEVVNCNDSSKWMIVMQEEMESLHKNGACDMVRLPREKKTIRCKWVFKKKEGTPDVENAMSKARLAAKGYNQILGSLKHSSIRALLRIVAFHDYELE